MNTNQPFRSTGDARSSRAARNTEYQAEQQRLKPFECIARFAITRRAELELTQNQLAKRMGTSHSAISRIESGQHKTSVETLARLADALESELVIGFEAKQTDKRSNPPLNRRATAAVARRRDAA